MNGMNLRFSWSTPAHGQCAMNGRAAAPATTAATRLSTSSAVGPRQARSVAMAARSACSSASAADALPAASSASAAEAVPYSPSLMDYLLPPRPCTPVSGAAAS